MNMKPSTMDMAANNKPVITTDPAVAKAPMKPLKATDLITAMTDDSKDKSDKPSKAKKEPNPKADRGTSKKDAILELVRRKEGATLEQLITATGWQKHSVHGQLANLRKAGFAISSVKAKTTDTRTYHLAH